MVGRVGYNLVESALIGGFAGDIYPVNPRVRSVLGLRTYPELRSLPSRPDLVVIAVNQYASVELLEECGRLGVKAVICIAGGFRETGTEGKGLEDRLVRTARKWDIALVGPNTLGVINPHHPFYMTFFPMRLEAGDTSVLSQSGGVGLDIIQKSVDEGLGICKWLSVGNRGTLEFADYLEYLAADDRTKVIGIFLEGTEDARRLVEVAGEVVRRKPVVVLKIGVSEVARESALTHTGSLAGSFRIYQDAFKQFRLIRVRSVRELIAACKALSMCGRPKGNRAVVFTHTAGPAIVVADHLAQEGCDLPALSEETLAGLESIVGPNPPVILRNPVDMSGLGFEADKYGNALRVALSDPSCDLGVAIFCLNKNWRFPTEQIIRVAADVGKPVIVCYISHRSAILDERRRLREEGIPLYTCPEEAAWAAAALVRYAEVRDEKRPNAGATLFNGREDVDRERADILERVRHATGLVSDIVSLAVAEGREVLREDEVKNVLSKVGIQVPRGAAVRDPAEAVEIAHRIGYPVVAKIASEQFSHKSDVGGVVLGIRDDETLVRAFRSLMAKGEGADPVCRVLVEEMLEPRLEMIVGYIVDEQFGPTVMCGLGGVFTEVLEDVVFRLAPVTTSDALEMLSSLRASKILQGYRNTESVDLSSIVEVLVTVSTLAGSWKGLHELDINPLAITCRGPVVLDARGKLGTHFLRKNRKVNVSN